MAPPLTEAQLWDLAQKNLASAGKLSGVGGQAVVSAYTQEISGRAQETGRTGYCVAYRETQNCFGPSGLHTAYLHASSPQGAGIIGMWPNGGQIYFDSVKQYSTKDAAVRAAVENGQIGIYNLASETYIPTPDANGVLNQINTGRIEGNAPQRRHSVG